jgi:hypothetical protein
MEKETSETLDIFTSKMLMSIARLIEGIEGVSLLPLGGTYAMPKRAEYNEFITDFKFFKMDGTLDTFDTIVADGQIKEDEYSCHLTDKNSFKQGMRHIVESSLPPASAVVKFDVRVEVGVVMDVWLHWRTQGCSHEIGGFVHNQIADPTKVKTTWQNLRFRSHSEMRIARALDESGALFLPNCLGRLSGPVGRKNLECDFVVCYEGKWGILEVDGEQFHPASRAAQDHERDRLFKAHGIRVVEHFDAHECFENAKGVVKKFVDILKQS